MAALEQVLSIIAAGKEGDAVFRMLRESPEIVRVAGPSSCPRRSAASSRGAGRSL